MSSNTALAFDELPRGAGNPGATEEIARTLRESGIDAPSGLYDEALALARDGHLAPASERLRMLLCLDPTDADASLLLGKILASRGQFQDALSNLDAAVAHGAVLPPGLRDRVEAGLQKQIRDAEEHRSRVAARERGEVQTLRAEAKSLRSENAGLELEVEELQRRVRLWSSATAVIAGVAAALLLATLVFGGGESTEETVAAAGPSEELVLTPTASSVSSSAAPTVQPGEASAASGSGTVSVGATPTTQTASVVPAATAAPKAESAASAKPAASSKSASASGGTSHTVVAGDTLGKLASRYYGNSAEWPRIQEANKDQLGGGTSLRLGQKLKIPAKN